MNDNFYSKRFIEGTFSGRYFGWQYEHGKLKRKFKFKDGLLMYVLGGNSITHIYPYIEYISRKLMHLSV